MITILKFSILLGILTVLITNPHPHYIVITPNLVDIYKDNNNIFYKYELKNIN